MSLHVIAFHTPMAYIYVYIYTHIYTYIHIHTYIHTPLWHCCIYETFYFLCAKVLLRGLPRMFCIQVLSAVVWCGFSCRLSFGFYGKVLQVCYVSLTVTCDVWFDPYNGVNSCVCGVIFRRLVDEGDPGRRSLFCRWSRWQGTARHNSRFRPRFKNVIVKNITVSPEKLYPLTS
jgi:hypothetical protein